MTFRYSQLPPRPVAGETGRNSNRYNRRALHLSALLRRVRRTCKPLNLVCAILLFLAWHAIFNASYTNPPPFTINTQDKVFIAANIIDKELIRGHWGRSLLDLVNLIGKDRVFVSIYGVPGDALRELADKLPCEYSVASQDDESIPLNGMAHTTLPNGETRIKRIAYLAEVRNKVIAPLKTLKTTYDKVLFINDVFFEPVDAARLLWGTNVNADGKAEYTAVCGADFATSWKFYDTFATRDLEGYSIGVPLFPWFADEGDAVSRNDVLSGTDAVRVKSCWGGMIAFQGYYFQGQSTIPPASSLTSGQYRATTQEAAPASVPLSFRSEPEPFIDSSECCLVHADIASLPLLPSLAEASSAVSWGKGIFMNPYVRVTYDQGSFSRLWVAKRFERLFAVPQSILNRFAHMPVYNPRRTEIEGEVIQDRLWVPHATTSSRSPQNLSAGTAMMPEVSDVPQKRDRTITKSMEFWVNEGRYVDYERVASRGGFCGVRQLLVLREGNMLDSGGNWENLRDVVPPLDF